MSKNIETPRENSVIERIKDKISDYLVETFKTRNSNTKKQEIIDLVKKNANYRNEIINYISDLSKNVREYQNCDDQTQLGFLLKDFNLSDEQVRTKIKLNICELWAWVLNNTGPLANKYSDYEVVQSNNSSQTTDWYSSYKWESPTEVESQMQKINEWEYKLTIDWNDFKLIYNWWQNVILSRMTYNKAIRKFPVIIWRWWVPYSNIEIDMGWGFKFKWMVNFEIPNNDNLKLDRVLLWNKRVRSELTQIWENTYRLLIDNFYNFKVKYNPISNTVQILNWEDYSENEVLYEWIAHPISLPSNNFVETRFGRLIQDKRYIMWTDFNIKIWRQNLTWTIIVPK